MTLTMETLRQAAAIIQPHDAGQPRLRVVVAHDLPRELIGHHVRQIKAHPHLAWLLRLLGLSDHVMWVGLHTPMYGPPAMYRIGNTLVCSPEQFADLRRGAA